MIIPAFKKIVERWTATSPASRAVNRPVTPPLPVFTDILDDETYEPSIEVSEFEFDEPRHKFTLAEYAEKYNLTKDTPPPDYQALEHPLSDSSTPEGPQQTSGETPVPPHRPNRPLLTPPTTVTPVTPHLNVPIRPATIPNHTPVNSYPLKTTNPEVTSPKSPKTTRVPLKSSPKIRKGPTPEQYSQAIAEARQGGSHLINRPPPGTPLHLVNQTYPRAWAEVARNQAGSRHTTYTVTSITGSIVYSSAGGNPSKPLAKVRKSLPAGLRSIPKSKGTDGTGKVAALPMVSSGGEPSTHSSNRRERPLPPIPAPTPIQEPADGRNKSLRKIPDLSKFPPEVSAPPIPRLPTSRGTPKPLPPISIHPERLEGPLHTESGHRADVSRGQNGEHHLRSHTLPASQAPPVSAGLGPSPSPPHSRDTSDDSSEESSRQVSHQSLDNSLHSDKSNHSQQESQSSFFMDSEGVIRYIKPKIEWDENTSGVSKSDFDGVQPARRKGRKLHGII